MHKLGRQNTKDKAHCWGTSNKIKTVTNTWITKIAVLVGCGNEDVNHSFLLCQSKICRQ